MSVKVTFEFDSNAAAAEFLQSLDDAPAANGAGSAEAAKPRGRGRPRKDAAQEPAAGAQAAAPAQAAQAAPAAPAAPAPAQAAEPAAQAAPAVAIGAVADAISTLADKGGEFYEKAVAILRKYGAAHMRELKPEHYAAVVAECKVAANPPAAATSLI